MTAGKGALIFGGVIAAIAGVGGYWLWKTNHPFGDPEFDLPPESQDDEDPTNWQSEAFETKGDTYG